MKKPLDLILATSMATALVLGIPASGLAVDTGEVGDQTTQESTASSVPVTVEDGIYQVAIELSDPNSQGMVKVNDNTGLLVVKNGKASLRFRLGGKGVDMLYIGTCAEAEKASSSSWIKYESVYEQSVTSVGVGYVEHYYFTVPVTVSTTGSTTIPMAIHSKSKNEWYTPDRELTFTYTGQEADMTTSVQPVKTKLSKLKSSKKKQLTATWKSVASNVTNYQVRYSTSKKLKKAKTVSVNAYSLNENYELAANTTVTVKKLTSKKKYYAQVRTYNGVTGTYSAWSATKSVKVK